jgi:RNA polymerase sigma factor (sigma-70 family)
MKMSANTYALSMFIQRLKDYDEQAWDVFFTRIYQRLRRDVIASLRRRRLPIQEADDVVQEALLTAFQKIGHVDCDDLSSLYHWIRVISFNHVRNRARKKRPYVSLDAVEHQNSDCDTAVDAFLFVNGCHELPVETTVILHEDIARVVAALNCVKARDREIFLRRNLDDEKPTELSTRFPDLKARSISQLLSRTRRTLQHMCAGSDGLSFG